MRIACVTPTLVLACATAVVAACNAPNPSSSGGPPELGKAEAQQIKAHMGCSSPNVVAVINGVGGMGMGAFSSPNVAFVLSVCQRNDNRKQPEDDSFWYDKELGWFYFEIDREKNRLRLWTKQGYSEVRKLE